MAETFSRYNAADYLRTDEEIAAYLAASAEDGDAAGLLFALGTVARMDNVAQLAWDTGLTGEEIYKVLSSDGDPAFATVVKVVRAMGFDVMFRPRAAS